MLCFNSVVIPIFISNGKICQCGLLSEALYTLEIAAFLGNRSQVVRTLWYAGSLRFSSLLKSRCFIHIACHISHWIIQWWKDAFPTSRKDIKTIFPKIYFCTFPFKDGKHLREWQRIWELANLVWEKISLAYFYT